MRDARSAKREARSAKRDARCAMREARSKPARSKPALFRGEVKIRTKNTARLFLFLFKVIKIAGLLRRKRPFILFLVFFFFLFLRYSPIF
jgi:hypothetical protein